MRSNLGVNNLFKISHPIIQAPMAGGITTPELIAAVSNAGCLGSLGAGYMKAYEIREAIKKIRQRTNNPFAVNLFIPEKHAATAKQIKKSRDIVQTCCSELNFTIDLIKPPYAHQFEEQMNIILEEKIPIFSFTFGILSEKWIETFKKNGILLVGTATSLEEAKLLEDCDIDAVAIQGAEAGGHRGTFIGEPQNSLNSISSLIPLVAQHIRIPVIAAGGIMVAQDIMNALKLGASAVQMGSAFLCCAESGAHPFYKKLLLNIGCDKTTLTRAFSGKLARGINNKFINRLKKYGSDILDYPIQNKLTSALRKEASKQNNIDFMSMWAGQSAHLCRAIPAYELLHELIDELNSFIPKSL